MAGTKTSMGGGGTAKKVKKVLTAAKNVKTNKGKSTY
jgi:hypothetical protein